MPKVIKRTAKKAGQAPGTLMHIGERKAESIRITVIDYDEQNYQEKQVTSIKECEPFKTTSTTTWINIDGLHQIDVIEEIGKIFDLHSLMLEDVLNTHQRPKAEDYQSSIFVVLKMLSYDEENDKFRSEQISLVLGSHYVITFQESVGDVFGLVRDRIKNTKWRIRKLGVDYLLYALIDCIVDHYFIVLEKMADKIESLQEKVATDPSQETLQQIHELKSEMIFFRKSVWPVRELVNSLLRSESPLIHKTTEIYLRDVYDHAVQIIDAMETYREMISGMLDVYLSSISNRMNAVMKVLTIIATIFIPLTFIAGIYGMNFEYMPELKWHGAYPAVWLVMATVATIMLVYFKKRKWL
ncbi:MAG: magnesium/cobalt transporter CorA [Sedimentisphaerales bacterium]|nr:magnesium/cobalt transporter CorA [Sedimentisphaerales bacterium]